MAGWSGRSAINSPRAPLCLSLVTRVTRVSTIHFFHKTKICFKQQLIVKNSLKKKTSLELPGQQSGSISQTTIGTDTRCLFLWFSKDPSFE